MNESTKLRWRLTCQFGNVYERKMSFTSLKTRGLRSWGLSRLGIFIKPFITPTKNSEIQVVQEMPQAIHYFHCFLKENLIFLCLYYS